MRGAAPAGGRARVLGGRRLRPGARVDGARRRERKTRGGDGLTRPPELVHIRRNHPKWRLDKY